jgi:hypothetical protein
LTVYSIAYQIQKKKITSKLIHDLFLLKVKTTDNEILKKFKENFFSFRNLKFNTLSDHEWFQENPSTSFTKNFFDLISNYKYKAAIISRKNFEAIDKWFQGSKFPNIKIYVSESLDKFNSKFNLISELQEKNGYLNAIYIDDMVSEFGSHNWEKINVLTLIAGWGYNELKNNEQEALNIIRKQLNDISH